METHRLVSWVRRTSPPPPSLSWVSLFLLIYFPFPWLSRSLSPLPSPRSQLCLPVSSVETTPVRRSSVIGVKYSDTNFLIEISVPLETNFQSLFTERVLIISSCTCWNHVLWTPVSSGVWGGTHWSTDTQWCHVCVFHITFSDPSLDNVCTVHRSRLDVCYRLSSLPFSCQKVRCPCGGDRCLSSTPPSVSIFQTRSCPICLTCQISICSRSSSRESRI